MGSNQIKSVFEQYKKIWIVIILIAILFIGGEAIVGNFLSLGQVLLTTRMATMIALFALCQMMVMCVGGSGLDLSIGYNATLTAVVTAGILDGKNENLLPAIIVAIGMGAAIGLANGFLSSYMRLPPLIVTLAMASILQGIINAYNAGMNITGTPSPVLKTMVAGTTGLFPNIVFVLIIVFAVVTVSTRCFQ